MLRVYRELLVLLPKEERYDLLDQLRRSTKAIPRLIAEGYGKKHQRLGFQKYLDDVLAECYETVVGIEQTRDLYGIDKQLCDELVTVYDRIGRQTYRLRESWQNFKRPV